MQMRIKLAFVGVVVLAGCSAREDFGRRVAVIAEDVCAADASKLRYETFYSEDSVSGFVSRDSDFSVDFYLGKHPDFSGVIKRSAAKPPGANVASITFLTYAEGFYVADVKLKGMAREQTLLFRSTNEISSNAEFLKFVGRLRRCRIN